MTSDSGQHNDAEVKFWMKKYFELASHTQQVIAMLARPVFEADVRAQADLIEKLAGAAKDHSASQVTQ